MKALGCEFLAIAAMCSTACGNDGLSSIRNGEAAELHNAPVVPTQIKGRETTALYTEPLTDIDGSAVFAPHLYSGWLRLYRA
jgi:hypothetical protein